MGIFGPRKEEGEGCQVLEGPEREKEITRKERKREGRVIKERKETFFFHILHDILLTFETGNR